MGGFHSYYEYSQKSGISMLNLKAFAGSYSLGLRVKMKDFRPF